MTHITEVFILAMLSIAFIQSGLNKLIDREGNLVYFNSVFKNTPIMRDFPRLLLITITILELLSGITSIIGIFSILFDNNIFWAQISSVSAGITFLSLFFGQRFAKDYAGAMTIVVYLIPVFFLLFLCF